MKGPKRSLYRIRTTLLTLFYNDFLSLNYVFDTLLEPLLWGVDNFTKILGPLFVIFVLFLNVSIVFVAYKVGLPFYWQKSPVLAIFLVIIGQYFKFNIGYYYYKAYSTHPGVPPKDRAIAKVSSVCKKCVSPKPPRTHHCSVCDACILKMDHHCPWLNNCVGHYNHRYFFLYMVYTVLGTIDPLFPSFFQICCIFIMVFGVELLYIQVFHTKAPIKTQFSLLSERTLIFYAGFMTVGTTLILGLLSLWHARLITRGETSIEAHINKSEAKRYAEEGKTYANPYNFGAWNNWCLFLGMIEGHGWERVLWPSSHPPRGSGLEWDTLYSCSVSWNEDKFE